MANIKLKEITVKTGIKRYEIKTNILGYGSKGIPGNDGKDGAIFTPHVSEDGKLEWTNDGNLINPEPSNILGPQGPQGIPGPQGVSGVYIGSEEPPKGYDVWIAPDNSGQKIPTKTSELELDNVYSKEEIDIKFNNVYSKEEIDTILGIVNTELENIIAGGE